MKKKRILMIILLLIVCFFCTGCSSKQRSNKQLKNCLSVILSDLEMPYSVEINRCVYKEVKNEEGFFDDVIEDDDFLEDTIGDAEILKGKTIIFYIAFSCEDKNGVKRYHYISYKNKEYEINSEEALSVFNKIDINKVSYDGLYNYDLDKANKLVKEIALNYEKNS